MIFSFTQDPIQRDVDSWIINNWVLGKMVTNPRDREEMAKARQFNGVRLSVYAMRNDHINDFLARLTREVCLDRSTWSKFVLSAGVGSITFQRLALSRVIVGGDMVLDESQVEHQLVHASYLWARYLTNNSLGTYFDKAEQLGVFIVDRASKIYECGEEIWALTGQLHAINIDIIMAHYEVGERWSFFGTSPPCYLSGPVSLINHACRNHSNVVIKRVDRFPSWLQSRVRPCPDPFVVAIAETRICVGDRVYATYDRNDTDLKNQRGIECNVCKTSKRK